MKRKKELVGVGNKETKEKKKREGRGKNGGKESSGIKGIRKSLKRPWRAHLRSSPTLRILVIIRASQKEKEEKNLYSISLRNNFYSFDVSSLFPSVTSS